MTYGVRLSILNIHFWKETDGVTCSSAMKSFTSIPKITEKWEIYRIAGNFQGRKLSRIGEKYNFRGENFHRVLTCAALKDTTPPNFAEKTFVNSHKTAKFAKVFSLESFLLYSSFSQVQGIGQ